jgi:hypothetical protein
MVKWLRVRRPEGKRRPSGAPHRPCLPLRNLLCTCDLSPTLEAGFVKLLRLRFASDEQAAHSGSTCPLGSPLRACQLGPTLEAFPHLLAVIGRGQQMPPWSEPVKQNPNTFGSVTASPGRRRGVGQARAGAVPAGLSQAVDAGWPRARLTGGSGSTPQPRLGLTFRTTETAHPASFF